MYDDKCGRSRRVTAMLLGLFCCWITNTSLCTAQIPIDSRFSTLVLTEEFHSEGANACDIDGDGQLDIVAGPFWYRGPEFEQRVAYTDVRDYDIKEYSDHFFLFSHDFDRDGDADILSIPIPGGSAVWFENPNVDFTSTPQPHWQKHSVLPSVDNESPCFEDINADGNPELICIHNGDYGFASWNPADPTAPWVFTLISHDQNLGRFTHGLGIGDINMDGRSDLLESRGWWEHPSEENAAWQFHAQRFSETGGAQMFAYDFDGDADNDVLSTQNAHGYGLSWFERRGTEDDYLFVEHQILTESPSDNTSSLSLSQMHAVRLADMDGDGLKDVITGKRFFAHGGQDPGAFELPLLVWLKTERTKASRVRFLPRVIHSRSGVGTQITIADIDQNGTPDVLSANKLGMFVAKNGMTRESFGAKTLAATESADDGRSSIVIPNLASAIGTEAFAIHVRDTEPLTAKDQEKTFVLPEGFEIQLFASEPQIAKPMNMAFDAKGRLWVTSSNEYPHPADPTEQGRDTLKVLEDQDGDGFAETVTTFADGLNIPMGVYPYLDGAICFSIPNILFLRDQDGDGKCDRREVLYGPMDTSRDTHGMCNAFTRGFDGWLYACHGFNNQTNVSGKDGHNVVMHSGNTFRMRVDGSRIEHFTHGQVNPFGMTFRSNGDLFSADCHTRPVTLLLQDGYYESFGKPHDGLGFVPDVMKHLHGSTGIGGIAIYDAGNFPPEYHHNSFGGNVMTGRINRNSLRQIGSTVEAREEPDFVVSSDPWFRPVDLQIGPDGALYVADFYNRIIGHYEVDLNHPGRDRHRGRIWKIRYTGSPNRRGSARGSIASDSSKDGLSQIEESENGLAWLPPTVQDLTSKLGSENLQVRMRATDTLVDAYPHIAGNAARQLLTSDNALQVVQAAWILQRTDQLSIVDMNLLLHAKDELVREHAFRVLGECLHIGNAPSLNGTLLPTQQRNEWLLSGFHDDAALVRRAAALSSRKTPDASLAFALLRLLPQTDATDVHLLYAIRMALRDHFMSNAVFSEVAKSIDPISDPDLHLRFVRFCAVVRSQSSGEYLARYIRLLDFEEEDQFAELLTFAARFSPNEHLPDVIRVAEQRYPRDLEKQHRLLVAMADSLQGREDSEANINALTVWASSLAKDYFGVLEDPIQVGGAWRSLDLGGHYLGAPDQISSCWQHSMRRISSESSTPIPLHSSFPNGEQRTGIYRSPQFTLPQTFSFFIAGHDGFPHEALGRKNKVLLRDATTNEVLQTWSPPRNDVAQRVEWPAEEFNGRRVYVDLVDADNGNAYAWLAVGLFSVTELNPSPQIQQWETAAELVRRFGLIEFRDILKRILRASEANPDLQSTMASTLVSLHAEPLLDTLSVSLQDRDLSTTIRRQIVDYLCPIIEQSVVPANANTEFVELLEQVCSTANYERQRRIAEQLSSEAHGSQMLLSFIERGKLARRLVQEPSIAAKTATLLDADAQSRWDTIRADLPNEDPAKKELMQRRLAELTNALGDRDQGRRVFNTNCAICHQVRGEGKAVGPNLDEIGNRGLERLVEDVALPNRNIDHAFQASIVLTEDGKVRRGLARNDEKHVLTLIDGEGKSTAIPIDEIEHITASKTSPMPDNFFETLTLKQTRDLFQFLMSLRN